MFKKTAQEIGENNHIYKIEIFETFIQDPKRQELLESIRENSYVNEDEFEALFMQLMRNIYDYTLSLPDSSNSYFTHTGGVFDYALYRTAEALNLLKKILLLENHSPSPMQKLWNYVLFSAGFLKNIGKLYCDYDLEILNAKKQKIKKLLPLSESFSDYSKEAIYYKYNFLPPAQETLYYQITLLLAYKIMPKSGMQWVSERSTILSVWLSLLTEDYANAQGLSAILIRADAKAVLDYLSLIAKNNKGQAHYKSLSFLSEDSNEDEQLLQGLEFLQWVTNQVENKRIVIGKQNILGVPGGLIMSNEAFAMFIKENPLYKSQIAVKHAFATLLGLKYDANGVMLKNSALLTDDLSIINHQIHNFSNSKESMTHLNHNGEWVDATYINNRAVISPKSKPGA